MKLVLIYLLLINLIGFFAMGIDKYKAKKNLWRIPENILFLLGMKFFRHKTKHWYFKFGMPAILILQIVLITYLGFQFSA